MKFTREWKIGLLVVISTFLLIFGINFLKGVNIFKPTNYYYTVFDNIDGLVKTGPVYSNGFQVGQVSDIRYNFEQLSPIVVEVTLDKKLVVPQGSKLLLFDTDIMGSKGLIMEMGTDYSILPHQPGDTLASGKTAGLIEELAGSLIPQIEVIGPQLDSLITSVRSIVDNKSLHASIASLSRSMDNIESASSNIKNIVAKDVPGIIVDAKSSMHNLNQISSNLKGIDFASSMNKFDNTISNLKLTTEKLNSKDNTIGLLLNDNALYNNLNSTAGSANVLLIDLKDNPKRYVHFSLFGGKDKEKKKDKEKGQQESVPVK